MDAYEATRIVFSRIQALDHDNAAKIMGLLLIQDHGEKEMIRLAFGPENLLTSVIFKAKKELGLLQLSPTPSSPFLLSRHNSSRPGPTSPSSWAPPPPHFTDDDDDLLLREQLSFMNDSQHWTGAQDGFGWKPCLYFARGFCKNGSACRFLHGPAEDISAAAAAAAAAAAVEQEIMLLRSKSQRLAVSAAFPYSPTGGSSSSSKCFHLMIQQQQNESQRAAAAAAIILENENCKFMGRPRMDREFAAGIVNPGSRQIYLTFPADSTFREEDVSNYFRFSNVD